MIAMLSLGLTGGAILCLRRFGLLMLGPVILLVAANVLAIGAVTGQELRAVILVLLTAIASLQIGFVLAPGFVLAQSLDIRPTGRGPTLTRDVQEAIAEELKSFDTPSQKLPPRVLLLLRRLNEQHATSSPPRPLIDAFPHDGATLSALQVPRRRGGLSLITLDVRP